MLKRFCSASILSMLGINSEHPDYRRDEMTGNLKLTHYQFVELLDSDVRLSYVTTNDIPYLDRLSKFLQFPSTMRLWFFILVLFALPSVARTQHFDESWRWVHFTTESGLPSNNIYDVIETPDSTLWAVCDAGIAWYDGFQWQPVQLPATHLPNSNTPLCDYRNDSLLIGFDDEWYAVGRQGFVKLSIPSQCKLKYFSGDTILCLKDGSLFFLIRGLLRPCEMPRRSAHERIEELHRTKEGKVWVRTNEGVYRWENNHWRRMFDFRGLPGVQYILAENAAGVVFTHFELPLELRGMWQYQPGSRTAHRVPGGTGDIQTIAISPSQLLIAAYSSGEVRVRTGTSWSNSSILKSKCKGLHNCFFRRNGDLIIATSEGIYYFTVSSSRWRLIPHGMSETWGVNEILTTRSGELWTGTANGIIINSKKGISKMVTHIGDVPMNTVTGLEEDREGNIWVSSGGSFEGAYRWDGSTWKYFQISKNKVNERFHKIRKDHRGRLWFLGLPSFFDSPGGEEPGVFLYENNQFIEWGKEHGFPDSRVYAFDEDAGGGLWFGTQHGISRWKNGAWQRWTKAQGLCHDRVFTLAIDLHKNVWFGHENNGFGLGCIDSSGEVKYFTTSDGLVSDFVWEVRVDSLGVLWITTRGGLVSYHDGKWSRFDESSGLQSNLLWPVLPLKDEVYVGTRNGVAILDRRESFTPAPRIVIDKPNIDRQDVHLRWRAYAYWGAMAPSEILTQYRIDDEGWSDWSKIRELDLKNYTSGEHTISVQARGLFGNYSQDVQRAAFALLPPLFLRPVVLFPTVVLTLGLIILGFVLVTRRRHYNIELRQREAKFRAVTETTSSAIFIYDRSHIHFMNSSAEDLTGYRLEDTVAMSMNDLITSEDREMFLEHCVRADGSPQRHRSEIRITTRSGEPRWLDFTSGPMTYQSAEMVLGTAFDITERKTADEKLRLLTSELISTEERERHRVAIFLHDEIGQALALCKIKLRSMQKSGSHINDESNLREILQLVDDSIKNTRSLTFDLSPPILYELNFPVALKLLTEQLIEGYSIHLEFSSDGTPIALKDEIKVITYHVVREIIINTIKHAKARQVTLDLAVRNGRLLITVTDDGIGFSAECGEEVFGSQHGFGLFNIRERLSHLGGALELHSGEGQGTRATISIPITTPTIDAQKESM
jgi:PAS domain S-box-containing protein